MPTADWEDTNLQELLPQLWSDLATAIAGLQATLQAVQTAQAAAAALIPPPSGALPSPAAGVAAAATVILTDVLNLLNNIRSTGASMLVLDPQRGGTRHFQDRLRVCLLDESNPERPNFSSDAWMTVMGVIAANEDAEEAFSSFDVLTNAFVSGDSVKEFVKGVDLVPTDSFVESFYRNQLAGTARPVHRCLWWNATVNDVLAKVMPEFLEEANRFLAGLQSWVQTDPLTRYAIYLQGLITRQVAQINELTSVTTALAGVFVNQEIRLFIIEPFVGGNAELVEGLPEVFGPQSNFVHSKDTSWTTGVVIIGGGTQEQAQFTRDLLGEIFGV